MSIILFPEFTKIKYNDPIFKAFKMSSIHYNALWYIVFICLAPQIVLGKIQLGVECLFSDQYSSVLRGKSIGLITNHTAIDGHGRLTSHFSRKMLMLFILL